MDTDFSYQWKLRNRIKYKLYIELVLINDCILVIIIYMLYKVLKIVDFNTFLHFCGKFQLEIPIFNVDFFKGFYANVLSYVFYK